MSILGPYLCTMSAVIMTRDLKKEQRLLTTAPAVIEDFALFMKEYRPFLYGKYWTV